MKKIFNRTLATIISATMILTQAIPTAAEDMAATASSVEEAKTEEPEKVEEPIINEDTPTQDKSSVDEEKKTEETKEEVQSEDEDSDETEDKDSEEVSEQKNDLASETEEEVKEEPAQEKPKEGNTDVTLLEMPQEQSEYIFEQYGEDVLNTYDITVPEGTEFPVQITFSADVSDDQAVILFHYTGDEWEEITPDEVDEGSITATFDSLSPVAVVDVSEEDKAEGTEITAEYKVNNEDAGYIEDNTAIANEYYEFVNWTSEDGEEVSAEAYFVAENDGVYTANFEAVTYTIEYKAADGGTVSTESEEVTIESGVTGAVAEADEGYLFVNWTSEDEAVVSEDAEFIPELKDGIYTANFKEEGYVVTYKTMLTEDSIVPEDGLFGTAFVNDTEETEERSKDAFTGATATASDGYRFVNWVDADGNEVSNKFTFIPSEVTEDAIYTAVFESIFVNTELSAEAGEQIITATGPMPRGAELVANQITYVKPVEETVNGSLVDQVQFTAFHAFDIKIMVDGEEWQPVDDNARVTITISGTRISEVEESDSVKVKVYRVEDDNENTTDMSATIVNSDTVSFETEHFTVYTVGSTDYDSSDATNSWDISASQNGSIMAYWYENDALLIITGSGDMKDYAYVSDGPYASPIVSNLKEKEFTVEWVNADDITKIGTCAFSGDNYSSTKACSNMRMTSLPRNINTIGAMAFGACSNITIDFTDTAVNYPELKNIKQSAFMNCKNITGILDCTNITNIETFAFCASGITGVSLPNFQSELASIASYAFRECENLTFLEIESDKLTSIGSYAFVNSNLTTVNIVAQALSTIGERAFSEIGEDGDEATIDIYFDSLVDLGEYAFYDNKRINTINLENTSIEAIKEATFANSSLKSIVIPDSVKTIEGGNYTYLGAFSKCTYLNSIDTAATYIGPYAFYNCTALDSISLNEIEIIDSRAFQDCTDLMWANFGQSLTSINSGAFIGCTKLSMPLKSDHTNLTTIGDSAFAQCDLGYIYIPQNVETIGSSAFSKSCQSYYIEIDLSDHTNLTSIGAYAFSGLPYVTNINLTGCTSLTNIGARAFENNGTGLTDGTTIYFTNCVSLISLDNTFKSSKIKSIDLKGTSIEVIPSDFFYFGYNTTLKKVLLPLTVKTISANAFRSQKNLNSINLNELTTLETIGNNAFNDCEHLPSIDLTSTALTQIGVGAFANCYSMESLKLPSSTTSIGDKAFFACASLMEIIASGNATVGTNVFKPTSLSPSGADPKDNYYLDGEYHEVTLPLKTTLIGDADWFDTYDWKSDYRLIGDYTVTLPMSIDLEYDGESFGNASYSVDNNTNDWPVVVTPWDSDSAYTSGKITLKDTEGNTLVLRSSDITYSTDYTTDAQIFETGENEKVITFTPQTTPTKEASYTGELTFKTAIKVG